MARRDASIWRLVTHAGSVDCSAKSPNEIVDPRYALPVMRPRITLRYFVRFGINMSERSASPHTVGDGQAAPRRSGLLIARVGEIGGQRGLRDLTLLRHHIALVHPNLDADSA